MKGGSGAYLGRECSDACPPCYGHTFAIGLAGDQDSRRKKPSPLSKSQSLPTLPPIDTVAPEPAAVADIEPTLTILQPRYIAPKTKSKSLRGSIVIKAEKPLPRLAADTPMESKFAKLWVKTAVSSVSTDSTSDTVSSDTISPSAVEEKRGSFSNPLFTGRRGNEKATTTTKKKAKGDAVGPTAVSVEEAVARVRKGGGGADFVVVGWGEDAAQLELKEVRKERKSVKAWFW